MLYCSCQQKIQETVPTPSTAVDYFMYSAQEPVNSSGETIGGGDVFTIYNDYGADATLVPNLFIDEYMTNANDAQIKVYLYLLRMMGLRRAASISDMAEKFNHTEREVLRSLRYWEKQGLLTLEYDEDGYLAGIHLCEIRPKKHAQSISSPSRMISLSTGEVPLDSAPAGADSSEDRGETVSSSAASPAHLQSEGLHAGLDSGQSPDHRRDAQVSRISADSSAAGHFTPERRHTGRRRKTSQAALEAYRSNEDRAQLLFIIEQYIGKPLSVNEMQVVYYISEELKFSDSLIDYLVQYCVDRGKKDFRYIEKVAVNWSEHGITTPKQAERAAFSGKRGGGVWSGTSAGSNKFNQFEQNRYDFDKLEQEILNN